MGHELFDLGRESTVTVDWEAAILILSVSFGSNDYIRASNGQIHGPKSRRRMQYFTDDRSVRYARNDDAGDGHSIESRQMWQSRAGILW